MTVLAGVDFFTSKDTKTLSVVTSYKVTKEVTTYSSYLIEETTEGPQ